VPVVPVLPVAPVSPAWKYRNRKWCSAFSAAADVDFDAAFEPLLDAASASAAPPPTKAPVVARVISAGLIRISIVHSLVVRSSPTIQEQRVTNVGRT
jgi:hypothetical protein